MVIKRLAYRSGTPVKFSESLRIRAIGSAAAVSRDALHDTLAIVCQPIAKSSRHTGPRAADNIVAARLIGCPHREVISFRTL